MKTRIKICCIATIAEAKEAVRAGADAVGLVGEMPSGPGQIPERDIREIAATVPPGVDTFLLSSRTEPVAIAEQVEYCKISIVQLVHSVPESTYEGLRERCPNVRIVQVLHVENETAIDEAHRVSESVDGILLDSGRPSAAVPTLGGTGNTHDWSISARIVEEVAVPTFLAGGLHPGNVAAAIQQVAPYGVDLCSGVRTNRKLDARLLRRFIETVHGADAEFY